MQNVHTLCPISLLRPHEHVDFQHVDSLSKQIKSESSQKIPILVDKKTLIILDGHHRAMALKQLGARYVCVLMVDYLDDTLISLKFWRDGVLASKKDIINAGLNADLYPVKTTRHILNSKHGINEVNQPLENLLKRNHELDQQFGLHYSKVA